MNVCACSWTLHSVFCIYPYMYQYHIILVTVILYQVLKSASVSLPALLSFEIVLAILVSLHFHMNFRSAYEFLLNKP